MSPNRQLQIRDASFSGESVVYIMSRDQRTIDNHALLYAQKLAEEHQVPLYVLFMLTKMPGRSREHHRFMIDGLVDVASSLHDHDIQYVMRSGNWLAEVGSFLDEVSAGALIFDFSPLQKPREYIKSITKKYSGPITIVDTHNIIPVWVTSDKQEYAAHTIRRKIHKNLASYMVEPDTLTKHPYKPRLVPSLSFADANKFIQNIPAANISHNFAPGERAASKHLNSFIETDLAGYARARNDFSDDRQSGLSPYLHFGQISTLRVALNVTNKVDAPPLLLLQAKMAQASVDGPSLEDGMNALFEEMIVRKELSDNFCYYNSHYLSLDGAPTWAIETLNKHRDDNREFIYTQDDWEQAQTHDEAWNAAQHQLTRSGKMHGYLRMYWAKKLLEWSVSPSDAIDTAIYLNDKYSLDGGDPNGYVGILWSVAGLHDRPWFERSVYGKIRYMNAAGLRRKYDIDSYIRTWK